MFTVLILPPNEEENSLCVTLRPERLHPRILSFPPRSQGCTVARVTPSVSKLPLYIAREKCVPVRHGHVEQRCELPHQVHRGRVRVFVVYGRNKHANPFLPGHNSKNATWRGKETGEMESQRGKVNKTRQAWKIWKCMESYFDTFQVLIELGITQKQEACMGVVMFCS